MAVNVPERVVPMVMIQVGITPEHLFDNRFDVCVEVGWETTRFADPCIILCAGQSTKGLSKIGMRLCNWSGRRGWIGSNLVGKIGR